MALFKRDYLTVLRCFIYIVFSVLVCQSFAKDSVNIGSIIVDLDVEADELIAYEKIGERSLLLHVFHAKNFNKNEKVPAIIFFHGGGWNSGRPNQFYLQADYFSKLGITVISAEYRKWQTDKTPPNVSVMDAKTAFRWVLKNSNSLNVDANKVIAGGASAGGHLAAAVASIKGFNQRNTQVEPITPAALLLLNPVVDMSEQGFGYQLVEEYWREISPLHNIKEGHPPTLILLGTNDHVVSVKTANSYRDKIRESGALAKTIIYPDKKHGFFNYQRSEKAFIDTLINMHQFLYQLTLIKQPVREGK
jgi:acetyl esterase